MAWADSTGTLVAEGGKETWVRSGGRLKVVGRKTQEKTTFGRRKATGHLVGSVDVVERVEPVFFRSGW